MDLIAKIGGFVTGMTEAERAADKSAKKIAATIKSIGVAGVAAGEALGQYLKQGIDLAITAFPELLEQAAQFQDLADKTGGTAVEFAGFAVAAKVSGTNLNDVASASVKLTKGLIGVDDESKAAGAALAALNIPIEEFKQLSPEDQLVKVSEALGDFKDGAGKTAVATALFGKAGADLMPFLKELYAQGGLQKILTAEQIKQADEYGDRLAKQKAEFSLTATAVASQFIPTITALTTVMTDLIKETLGVSTETTELGRNQGIQQFVERATDSLGTLLDAVQLVARGFDLIGTSIGIAGATAGALANREFKQAANIQIEGAKDLFDKVASMGDNMLSERLRKGMAAQRRLVDDQNSMAFYMRGNQKELNFNGTPDKAGGGADDPTKKLLENELSAMKAQGEAAKELLSDRNKVLDAYNAQGLLSVEAYYEALKGNMDEATASQAKAIDDQIAALEKYRAAAAKQTDVADATGKINKLQEDKAKLYRAAGTEALLMQLKEDAAAKSIRDAFSEVNAKILEYQGRLREAAAIRFDAANEKTLNQAIAKGDELVQRQIASLRDYALSQADVTAATEAFALAQGDLQIAEDRITMARERGTMGEIESLIASGKAREAAIAPMRKQLAALEAIDGAVRSDAQNQAIERLKVQLEGLEATLDPLADKFNTVFGDAAGSALSDFITGTKTAKEAFKSFADSVFRELINLAAKDVFRSFFGKGGSATGGAGLDVGGFLSSLLGGGSSTGKSSSGSGVFSGLASLFGFASGGFTGYGSPSQPAGIVHKGEYVLNAKQTAAIGVGNLAAGNFGGGSIVINQNFPPGTNRATTDQAALSAARAIERARRNS
ncbi:hypothetical protein [Variovorax sp.]|uniref:hypothetical protein n=1 Tax=Variovorax sp. TaxID=1871043 RepID=UPI0040382DDB